MDAAQCLDEARVAAEIATKHEDVDDEPDQRRQLGAIAVRDHRADDDVVLLRVAGEHSLVRREQRYEQRHALIAGERSAARIHADFPRAGAASTRAASTIVARCAAARAATA